jgi:hypothetical protein
MQWELTKFNSFVKFCENMKTIFSSIELRNGIFSQSLKMKYAYADINEIIPTGLNNLVIGSLENFISLVKPLGKVKGDFIDVELVPLESNPEINHIVFSANKGKTIVKSVIATVNAIPDKYKEKPSGELTNPDNLAVEFEFDITDFDILKSTKKIEPKIYVVFDKKKNEFYIHGKTIGSMYDFIISTTPCLKTNIVMTEEATKYSSEINYDTLYSFLSSTKMKYMRLYIEDSNEVILFVSSWELTDTVNIQLYERARMKSGNQKGE